MSDKYSFIISIPLVPAILLLDHLMSSLWSTLVNTLFPVFNAWSCLARTWLSALSVCLCSCGTNHYLMYSGDFCSGSRWVFAEVQSVRATVTTWVAASVNINNQKWPFESQNSNNVSARTWVKQVEKPGKSNSARLDYTNTLSYVIQWMLRESW